MAGPRSAPRRPAAGATPGADGPGGFAARRRGRLRALPSVDEVVRALDGRPAASRARVVDAVRTVLAERRRAVLAAASPAELDALTLETPALLPRVRAALDAAGRLGARPRGQRDRGGAAHEPRPRAPRPGGAGAARARRRPVLESRAGRSHEGARLALRARGRSPLPPLRSGGLARGQQQRRGRPARARVARAGREVVVSRGELIEIGGDFRIPDIMARSGRRLREVGTTNRTHLDDYASAIAPETALLLKVHRRTTAWSASPRECPHRGARRAGPGARRPGAWRISAPAASSTSGRYGPSARADGARDGRRRRRPGHLLGRQAPRRPAGRASSWAAPALVERLRQNPLNRALRIDKLTLAALEATLAPTRRATAPRDDPDPPHADRAGGRRPCAARAACSAGCRRPPARRSALAVVGRPVPGGRRRAAHGRAPDRGPRPRDRRAPGRGARRARSARAARRSSAASPTTVCSSTAGPIMDDEVAARSPPPSTALV